MAESTCELEYFFFPAQVWLRIALDLDIESLQALQDSKVVPWDVCEELRLRVTITLSPRSDASALLHFLVFHDASPVKVMRLTGCLTAHPRKVFLSISLSVHLVELYCVNCVLCPRRLFDIVASLPKLTRLEWSLFDEHTYGERFDIPSFASLVLPNLRQMYIEVAGGFASCDLAEKIKQCCVNLEHLHVHALHGERWVALEVCGNFQDPYRMLKSVGYTSQWYPENIQRFLLAACMRVPHPQQNLFSGILGNVTFRVRPAVSCTYVHLKQMIASPGFAIPLEELVFCVEWCPDAPAQLAEVVICQWVQHLRSLTFVLLPSTHRPEIGCRCHYVSPEWYLSVSRFLNACRSLTELNLSLVHFERGTDLCQLFPSQAVPLLRAIALPQCGLQTTESVKRLAASCPLLQELDVRGGDGMSAGGSDCPACSLPFVALNMDTARALHRRTRLQRLTLCCCRGLKCVRFLAECSLLRLRLSWSERSIACCNERSFLPWLASSEHLHSLTLDCLHVSVSAICSELMYAGVLRLRTLCIVSGAQPSDRVHQSISELTRVVSLLESVHVYYLDEYYCEHTVTWIRPLRLGFPNVGADGHERAFLLNLPCSPDCSMTTFIGLKKPRH